jgi:hypothetical protein
MSQSAKKKLTEIWKIILVVKLYGSKERVSHANTTSFGALLKGLSGKEISP